MKAIDRLYKYIEYKEFKPTVFEREIGLSSGYLSVQRRRKADIGETIVNKINDKCHDISIDWLLTGEGDMLKSSNEIAIFKPEDLPMQVGKLYRAPIFESYPVSAGNMGLASIRDDKPDGYAYTTMPGVTFFPVVGCSFEPIIKAGHYIGIIKLDSWDRVDTEKIYFILTREERMIKRLRIDEGDQSALWCVSPNFKEFKILKSDILEISHVFFYGMMV